MSAAPPLIGLTTYREPARWGVWDQPADLLPANYSAEVVAVGGVPVLLPPSPPTDEEATAAALVVVRRLDGLIISGGADVDPARYGEEPHPATAGWRPDRDRWEVALLTAAEETGLPVLGVCRGMQVMAVATGGRLEQHTPERVGDDRHSPGGDVFGSVRVSIRPESSLAALVPEEMVVHCHHHQAVLEHPGFTVSAHAADGTVEAIEAAGDRFCLGVQWHPEMADVGLFAGLARAAAAYRAQALPG